MTLAWTPVEGDEGWLSTGRYHVYLVSDGQWNADRRDMYTSYRLASLVSLDDAKAACAADNGVGAR